MGYRVEYFPEKERAQEKTVQKSYVWRFCALFFALFLVLSISFWPEGRETLQKLLFSGDVAVTTAALENLAWELELGEPIGEALEGFCREIIVHGTGN